MISAKIILDSMNREGDRLTSMEVVMPRFILAEFNTHRAFSRNSASSRAIPTRETLRNVNESPFTPSEWPRLCKGMSSKENLNEALSDEARRVWEEARGNACQAAQKLTDLGVHKQIANRLIEPFMYHTVLVTSTEWCNFFDQRCSPQAQPEMASVAYSMLEAYNSSHPSMKKFEGWHLPYITSDDGNSTEDEKIMRSVARCARVSYARAGDIRDRETEIELTRRLVRDGHHSPLEHVAQAWYGQHANFAGWRQLRHIKTKVDYLMWKFANV